MGDFTMPSLGADMDAGTLVEWRVAPGAAVKRGDVVALVETQKGIVEIEIWETGVVERLLVAPGAKVPVGTVLATVRAEGAPATATATAPATPARVRASPAARQLARERGVDVSAARATGPGGSVTREDVERMARPAPSPAKPAKPAAMRDAIAAAMSRSKREIPHYYLAEDVDVTPALAWLERWNAPRPPGERALLAAMLVRATALAAREVPETNGFWRDGAFVPARGVHVGVAISLRQGGLVAPAILDADEKPLAELMAALRDLTARARSGGLKSSELSEPTITVTNLGDRGVGAVFGVIYPPQVALVGFGKPAERAFAHEGVLGVRTIVTATLAADHRASDGARGARFLQAVARRLARPEELG